MTTAVTPATGSRPPAPAVPDFIGSALDAYGLRAAVLRAGPEASFARIGELRPAMELAVRAWAERNKEAGDAH